MSERTPPRVVVLGGGSAGWITACLLHLAWGPKGGQVTLVESPDIGIIGVGEGSTPQLKALFDHLGIPEAEWMAACDATYKFGIRFTGWSERPGYTSYFHAFPGPVDLHTEPAFIQACALARRGADAAPLPDRWFLAARLAEERRVPHPPAHFPFPPNYGYHFDAFKLGGFLRDWAVARGVDHRERRVTEVALDPAGDVAALVCDDGDRIEGDLFVDCSGFAGAIAQKALGTRFVEFGENLFNDRAVVMPTPAEPDYRFQTESIAMAAGWRWRIPLSTRVGNGYVYSSRYISDAEAEAELRAACGSDADARFLTMRVGRVATSWTRNCLATGLAQGFIEPLEATALHIVIATAREFIQAYEAGGMGNRHRDRFNASIAARYDGIRDYIVAHYRMNSRTDTAYWRDNAANGALSDNLKAMITAWFTHADIAQANGELYPDPPYAAMSWYSLFAGYGTFPDGKPGSRGSAEPLGDHVRIREFLENCAMNFPRARPSD